MCAHAVPHDFYQKAESGEGKVLNEIGEAFLLGLPLPIYKKCRKKKQSHKKVSYYSMISYVVYLYVSIVLIRIIIPLDTHTHLK